ncbi:helix-turn-helix domain-containing protein [Photobacterium leiognathi]|uniref:helix-turn-helix domain-containing protein n=1 Tax=Photobacterium leiognathi TaxID=553611 RepID=UPI0005A6EF62|nr:helix-turn-helix transcriptional regulator [Photobacterium leiognathi]PSW54250.1 XRE family transcriptional regulator [Photobacterium leiognathi subsp. mandapamensis]
MTLNEDLLISKEFGARVKNLRSSRGLSQKNLADITGLSRSYISGIEQGERNISLSNINKLALGLNISLHELFKDING